MRILYNIEDIFALPKNPGDAVCITTNGDRKRNGLAVMGAGIAKHAAMRFNNLAQDLGMRLAKYGNKVYDMETYQDAVTGNWIRIITFPTKHHWHETSDLELIKSSARQLSTICSLRNITRCYIPCPGCGKGGLDWESQVKPLLETILDDRFIIADYRL